MDDPRDLYPRHVSDVDDSRRVERGRITYRPVLAVLPSSGKRVWAIVDADGAVHPEASDWARFLVETAPFNTAKSYVSKVAAFLTWCASNGVGWRTIDLTVLAAWKHELANTALAAGPRQGHTPSASTVSAYVSAVLHFYRWAGHRGFVDPEIVTGFVVWKRMASDYAGELPTERLVRVPELRVAVPEVAPEWIESTAEMDRVLGVPMNVRDWCLVSLLFATGMRIGEALTLHRDDLHLVPTGSGFGCHRPGAHVHIRASGQTDAENGMARKSNQPRTVWVRSGWVQDYAAYSHERVGILGADDNPHVFVNLYREPFGMAMSYDTVRRLFERISRQSGVRVTPHVLRHTRASWWLHGIDGAKVDARTVKELLGHKSLSTTDIYVHARESSLREAVEAVAVRRRTEDVE